MKLNKLIYWTSPLLALVMYTGILTILISIEKGKLYLGTSLPLFYTIAVPIIVTLGYITAYSYQKLKYRKIVLFVILFLFLTLEVISAIKGCFVYDFTKNEATLTFIIGFLRGILVWSSYSFFLVTLLYWSSREERKKIRNHD